MNTSNFIGIILIASGIFLRNFAIDVSRLPDRPLTNYEMFISVLSFIVGITGLVILIWNKVKDGDRS